MVVCRRIDGNACSCDLDRVEVRALLITMTKFMFKFHLGTITYEEIALMRELMCEPYTKLYTKMYIEDLETEQQLLYQCLVNSIY